MSKIVVLTNSFLGSPSANGICARNLVDELSDRGHTVEVICYQGEVKATIREHIHPIPQPLSTHNNLITKIIRRIKILFGATSLLLNQKLVEDYFQKLCDIHKLGHTDIIIAMYFPFETVEALYRFKLKNRKVKAVIFELDSVGDGVSESEPFDIINKAYNKWSKRIYKDVNSIVVMKSHEIYWRRTFGNESSDKLIISDLPVLIDKTVKNSPGNGKANMLYSGLIEKRYRSPSYLLDVLRALEKKMPFEMSFYSKGDCENEIAEAAKSIKGIRQCGYVTPEELETATLEADVLISIGNSFSNSVPSKLISYLGYGKPIIHFSAQKDDICNSYLNRYPIALIVDQSMPVDFSAERIFDFLKNTKGKRVSSSDLEVAFPMNYPRYSAEIIGQKIEKKICK